MVRKDTTVLSIGMTSFAIAILLRYISYDNFLEGGIFNFIEGVLIGLSLTMSLFLLYKSCKKSRSHV